MKKHSLLWLGTAALISGLTACGLDQPQPPASSSTPASSSAGSSSSTSGGNNSTVNIQTTGGYTALPSGVAGLTNFQATAIDWPEFDRAESLKAFEETLYEHLRSSGCVGCHSNETQGQAPLHSDGDSALAHEYALTKVYFKNPQQSRFVERMRYDRHNCPGSNCARAADDMLDAVQEWVDRIDHMIPDAPRGVAAGTNISESEMKSWIDADKNTIPSADQKYMVYTSLHELHNEGLTSEELNIVRTGLSKALNSTARWAPDVVNPTDVNGKGILYRFDVRDYWGYNQGVDELFFGGSDDDLAFGNGKRDYRGNAVQASVQNQKYNFTNRTTRDPEHALRIWERVLHGNVEGAVQQGTIPPYIDGFHGPVLSNQAGEYIDIDGFEWAEAAQLIYTLTRPDVYNAIMMNPFYADEMERNLEVDNSRGVDSYEYIMNKDAITVDSRLLYRAKAKSSGKEGSGWYWKTWDVFTGQLASGRDRSIYDVYADPTGQDIRFPFWANPVPKFVKWLDTGNDNTDFSFIASLNQTFGDNGGFGFAGGNASGCDNQPGAVQGFGFCRHYTGVGGAMQSASEIIYDLPNGLQGYYLTGGFNQRRVDAFTNIVRDPRILDGADDNIAYMTGYSYTNGSGSGQFARAGDPRLNTGSSCIGCHVDGMNRLNNDLRLGIDQYEATGSSSILPPGRYGVDTWIDNAQTRNRVKELYKDNTEWKKTIESDRRLFLETMGKIKEEMIWGDNKNVFVEPIIWTVEYVQHVKYRYPQTTSN